MALNLNSISTFKWIAHKVMPLVYDESLSYYEFLCKVLEKLNEVITNDQLQNGAIEDMYGYFDRLEHQMEALDYEIYENFLGEGGTWETYKAQLNQDIETEFARYEGASDQHINDKLGELQTAWNNFFQQYSRTFGIIDNAGTSTQDAMSQRATTEMVSKGLLNERLFQMPEIAGDNLYNNGDIEIDVVKNINHNWEDKTSWLSLSLPAGDYCYYIRETNIAPLTTSRSQILFRKDSQSSSPVAISPTAKYYNFTLDNATSIYIQYIWCTASNPPADGEYHGYMRGIKICAGHYTGKIPLNMLDSSIPTPEDLNEINNKINDTYKQQLSQRVLQSADITGNYIIAPNDISVNVAPVSSSWGQLITDIPLGNLNTGNYCLYARDFRIDDYIVERNKIYIFKNTYETGNIIVHKNRFDYYNNFTVDENADIYLRIYWSINNTNYHPASEYVGFVKGMKVCNGFYTEKIPSTMIDDSVTAIGKAINGNHNILESNDEATSISITVPQLKKNFIISYYGLFSSWNTLTISQGKGTGYTEIKCEITDTNVNIYKSGSTTPSFTEAHNLTLGTYITVNIEVKENNKCKIYICSNGQTYTSTETTWWSYRSNILAEHTGNWTNILSWGSADFLARTWLYGDSYFDHWLPKVIERGYTNFLEDGYSGGTSANGLASLRLAIEKGMPNTIIWCLGMNSPDSSTAINAVWKVNIDLVKAICDLNGINLIVTTIPNVCGNGSSQPARNHTFKNAYIRENFNYIDLASFVGSDISNEWYTGLLSSDGVHPSTVGDFFIANIMQTYLADLNNF